jgi:hypothetical protein
MSIFGYVSIFPLTYLDDEPLGFLVAVSDNVQIGWESTYYPTAEEARAAALRLADTHGLFVSDASQREATKIVTKRSEARHG